MVLLEVNTNCQKRKGRSQCKNNKHNCIIVLVLVFQHFKEVKQAVEIQQQQRTSQSEMQTIDLNFIS